MILASYGYTSPAHVVEVPHVAADSPAVVEQPQRVHVLQRAAVVPAAPALAPHPP